MFRTGIILAVVGLLVVDPILCRTAQAEAPCPGHGHAQLAACPDHPEPSHSDPESAHGCICQGATSDRATKQQAHAAYADAVVMCSTPNSSWLLATTGRIPSPLVLSRGPATGRAICISNQSLLI
ncbi:hypothetical protein [Tautonia sociabilis]|uniref:Uncharacterized protein n=1 Tax=Tautonia sociabilis TaxID=2080755 RepID=A0A432MPU4_9BACT|nr:hypothetical protein [Tautonia sociabilis]RUL89484.1 hypothetical protein TsocGM_01555 [Tautonia sociabilis]